MKREMDLIRDILLKIEGGQKMFETLSSDEARVLEVPLEKPMSREEADRLIYHLDLLDREGTIEIEARLAGGSYLIKGLTWQGHDCLERSAASAHEEPRKGRLISDEKNPEVLTLKPTFMGMSVNLKELWRQVSALWTRQK